MSDSGYPEGVSDHGFRAAMYKMAYRLTGGGSIAFGLAMMGLLTLCFLVVIIVSLVRIGSWLHLVMTKDVDGLDYDDGSGRHRWRFRQGCENIRIFAAAHRAARRESMAMRPLSASASAASVSPEQRAASRQAYYRAKILGRVFGRSSRVGESGRPPAYDSVVQRPEPVLVADARHQNEDMV